MRCTGEQSWPLRGDRPRLGRGDLLQPRNHLTRRLRGINPYPSILGRNSARSKVKARWSQSGTGQRLTCELVSPADGLTLYPSKIRIAEDGSIGRIQVLWSQ